MLHLGRASRVDFSGQITLARYVVFLRLLALALALALPASAFADDPHEGHGHEAQPAHHHHGEEPRSVPAATPAHAHAEHHGHALLGGVHDHGTGPHVAVSLGLIASTYRSPLFEGTYQGAIAGARVSLGRVGAAVSLPAYHLVRNGASIDGIGDVMLHAHATLLERGTVTAGAMMMASVPTGDGDRGLGMGHVMLMPEAWATWVPSRFAVAVSAGYGYAFGGASAHAHHGGGMWPLVEPMNASEITFGGTGMFAVAPTLGIGVRAYGATPTSEGDTRLAGGARVVWIAGRLTTTAELLGGLVGEPFGARGMLETSIRFD